MILYPDFFPSVVIIVLNKPKFISRILIIEGKIITLWNAGGDGRVKCICTDL